MTSSDGQIDKLQRVRPKKVELPDVNINTDAQGINTERASLLLDIAVYFAILPLLVVWNMPDQLESANNASLTAPYSQVVRKQRSHRRMDG